MNAFLITLSAVAVLLLPVTALSLLLLMKRRTGDNKTVALPNGTLANNTIINYNKKGIRRVDFEFEGDDIIFLCRSAVNNANDYHDANYSTFHKIENFRELL